MTDEDIDEVLKELWIEVLNPYNNELINQQINRFANLTGIEQSVLRYRGKFYFVMGRYKQALADLTKLLEFETNDTFALRYRGETYYMMEKYKESLADLKELLKINANDMWALKAYDEVIRK